jgi:hypothetical protein
MQRTGAGAFAEHPTQSPWKSLKISTATAEAGWSPTRPHYGLTGDADMSEKTCAACDCKLDATAISVKIGTRVVEVCCDECAQKLREAIPEKKS